MTAALPMTVRVVRACWESEGVLSLRLRATGGQPLPPWEPGAHIDVILPSGLVRQYSLCGSPDDPDYTVAVLRERDGRGGSAEIHDTALLGRELRILGPRNHFRLEPAAAYVFVAGGIGITPLLPMIAAACARGVPWELHYGGRRADTLAFTGELSRLAERSGATLRLFADDTDGPLPLGEIVGAAPREAMLYACGPGGMLSALADVVEHQRGDLPLRFERFEKARSEGESAPGPESSAFEVELASTGETVTVHEGQSILDAVREKRPDVLFSCEEGFCGTCETKVLAGSPVHRDTILSERERARNASMMICVGGCASARLVLDL